MAIPATFAVVLDPRYFGMPFWLLTQVHEFVRPPNQTFPREKAPAVAGRLHFDKRSLRSIGCGSSLFLHSAAWHFPCPRVAGRQPNSCSAPRCTRQIPPEAIVRQAACPEAGQFRVVLESR